VRSALIAFLLLAIAGQALVVGGVWLLAGLGWALLAAAVLPISAALVLARGLSLRMPNEPA
jgi:hypothetical protein